MQLLTLDQFQSPMHTVSPSTADQEPLKSLAIDYLNLFCHGAAFSDVIFSIEGNQVHAHRCILAARSSFFRSVFCKAGSMVVNNGLTLPASGAGATELAGQNLPLHIPVGIVGYDVFVIVLQFLYSGNLILAFQQDRSKCMERGCWHAHCSSHVDLALDTLHAASFFGLEQLSIMVQRHLGSIVEKVSIDDVMRVLAAAKKQGLHPLWTTCSELVAKSGLAMETLRKHLPSEIASEIEEMRLQRAYTSRSNGFLFDELANNSCSSGLGAGGDGEMTMMSSNGAIAPASNTQHRIRKMRQALDSLDVELVRLMVMGEGLELDRAQALHYSVSNCSRDVVKALLEMGAVNVNHPDESGRMALHIACEMASPDMISVLLDHHASPLLQTNGGDTPVDIIQGLINATSSTPPQHGAPEQHDQNKLRLCLELLQSAAYVADKEDEFSDGVVTEPSSDNTSCRSSVHRQQQHLTSIVDVQDCSSASLDPLIVGCSAGATAIATPPSLHSDWGSIESCCAFEQEYPASSDKASNHDNQQNNFLLRDRACGPLPLGGQRGATSHGSFIDLMLDNTVNMSSSMSSCSHGSNSFINSCNMISSNFDGFLYPDFRMSQAMAAAGQAGHNSPNNHNTTIF